MTVIYAFVATPAPHTHDNYNTRVIRNKPRNYIAELYATRIAQLVKRSYVKREVRGLTPGSGLCLFAIFF